MKFKLLNKLNSIALLLVLLLQASLLSAQNVTVKGNIVDPTGEAIIGATIQVAGTTVGTITDIDGNFSIECPSKSKLNISYIGYKSQSVTPTGKSLTIQMMEDSQVLDDIVVVGYGVQRKSDLTGSVSSVKMGDAIKSMPVANVTDALQGRLAGVSIVGPGSPGTEASIRVRGINSFSADTGPLVVIDGFIGGSLGSLNPSDILSVEVLKDASATAVYGSRGANGVILVTTKSPDKGKIKVDYSGYINLKTPYKLPDMLNPGEFADLANAYAASFGNNPYYDEHQLAAFKNGTDGYDYVGNIYRDVAIQHMHELSISGGSEHIKFLFSGSYNYNEGTVVSSNAQRANYRLKVDADVFKWLKVGVNFWGDYSTSQGPRISQYRGVLIESLLFPNTIMPRNANGKYNNSNLLGPQYNPMGHVEQVNSDGYAYNSFLQGYLDITFLPGFTFRMLQGVTFGNSISGSTNGIDSYAASSLVNGLTSATMKNESRLNWTNTNILSYVKEFNANHRINTTLVFEQQIYNTKFIKGDATELVSDKVGHDNLAFASRVTANSSNVITSLMSGLARINYALYNRYMFTLSYRMDGSSRLATQNAWEGFAAAAVAWDIRNEPFFEPAQKHVDQLKLRFGYGQTGNQAVAAYSAYNEYEASRDKDQNLILTLKRIGNPNLKWERTSQYNVGLDMGFLNNRLTFNIDAYYKMSDDVLLNVDVPQYTGFATALRNAAGILNKGIEVTIGADPFTGKDFSWNTNLTLSTNSTSVEKLAGGESFITLGDKFEDKFFRYILGEKVGAIYGYQSDGVWSTEEIAQGLAPSGTEAGSYKYKNMDDDPNITDADRTIIGNGQPIFNWGWSNTLNYKDFDFSLFIVGYHGFDIYNYTRQERTDNLSPNPDLLNRWQAGTNEQAKIAGFITNSNIKPERSQFIEKGDFVKIKNITVGYSLPKAALDKCRLSKLRFYASVQNPFLFTGYSGMDPETALKDPLKPGIDYGYYPNGRNFLIGLNIAF